ncbi:cytochrome P450 [Rhodococcus sp. H29-C3]|uniref:cytochrome P450 n=1 Tax=Rhodococcus sp. H29-C3 TaxID=3046307 RepID=UPI0024BB2876|nr:cytochrome P450 [Rhodococcus sp. H29-C3]MDJ0362473.1 cytochrome P450 [Rhodococcus sp. H29-C3]
MSYFSPFLVNMDGDEHAAARRRLIGEFSIRKMTAFRPIISSIVREAMNDLLDQDPPADFVEHFSNAIPNQILSKLTGIPETDLIQVERNTQEMLHGTDTEEEQRIASDRLHAHLSDVVAAKAKAPSDDLLSRLISDSTDRKGAVDSFEIASVIQLLQVAGHASSSAMISLSLITLSEHPEQFEALRRNPRLIPSAVEELLRFLSITDTGPLRLAVDDVELDGYVIKSGEGMVIPTLPANRDGAYYDEPDTFDIARKPAHRHIAFGFGAHQCLGQNLVRIELEEVLSSIIHQSPSLRLYDSLDEISFRYFGQFFGPAELRVTWDR